VKCKFQNSYKNIWIFFGIRIFETSWIVNIRKVSYKLHNGYKNILTPFEIRIFETPWIVNNGM
jgi:hypothetical protein